MREDRGIVNTVFCLYRKKRVIVNKSSCIYRKTGVFLTYGSYRVETVSRFGSYRMKSVKTNFAIQFHLNNIMPVFGFILLIGVDTFTWLNDRNIEYIIDIYKKENDNWQACKHNRKFRRKMTTVSITEVSKEKDHWQAWKYNRKYRRKRTTDRHNFQCSIYAERHLH